MGQEDPLEKEMASHASILVWRILWTEEPGQLQSMVQKIIRHDLATAQHQHSKTMPRDFPGGPLAKNLPAKAEDTGSIPCLGRSHML